MKLSKIIKSTILCIKFPFLYPRNRWTSLHYNNWKIIEFLNNHEPKTVDLFFFTEVKENKGYAGWSVVNVKFNDRIYLIKFFENILTISNNEGKVLFSKPSSYFGNGKIVGLNYRPGSNTIQFVTANSFVKHPTNPWVFTYIGNKPLHLICKVVNWLHKYPIQWLHCIPKFTELDLMDTGWRKAFGIQMCKEIKAALKKNHYLYKYRITDIKEKFGGLRWYDAGAPKEVHDIITKYEQISYNTCIICGKPATYISRGWISPYCSDCVCDREHNINIEEKYDRISE